MTDREPKPCKFHSLHYNFVAKRLREAFDISYDLHESATTRLMRTTNHAVITDLAMDFACSFAKDNPNFDPLRFLDACSPDTELYPFSELWGND